MLRNYETTVFTNIWQSKLYTCAASSAKSKSCTENFVTFRIVFKHARFIRRSINIVLSLMLIV